MSVSKFVDPYELKARLFPGLLVLAPAIIFLGLTYGPKAPIVAALGTIATSCGGPYALANFVRSLGQSAQERLFERWGASPSTMLLRHRDRRLPKPTKLKYHRLIEYKLGVGMPTEEQELANPEEADQAYAAAADALRPMTNDAKKFPFILKELVAYGFNRNSYGAKWVALLVCLIAGCAVLIHEKILFWRRPYYDLSALNGMSVAGSITLIIAAVLGLAWMLHFREKIVEQAGYSYALRLWEALEKIPKKADKSQLTKPAPPR